MTRRNRQPAFFEPLEDRKLFAIDFAPLASELASKLTSLDASMGNVDSASNVLPVINQPLRNIPDVRNVFKNIKQTLVNAVTSLNGLPEQTEPAIKSALFAALADAGAGLLADGNGDGLRDANDITITNLDAANGSIEIQFDLAKHFGSGALDFGFGTGIGNLPIGFDASENVSVGVDLAYNNFTFGATNNVPYFKADASNELSLGVSGFVAGSMSGTIGFLNFNAQDSGDPTQPEFQANLTANVTSAGAVASPKLTGAANATIGLTAAVGASASQGAALHTDLFLGWQFNNVDPKLQTGTSFGSEPVIELRNVSLSLGSVMSEFIGPTIDVIQKITKPIQPLFDALEEPIPVLSDLYHLVTEPDRDFTMREAAEIVIGTGALGPGYTELAQMALVLVDLTSLVNDIQASPDANNLMIDFGNCNLNDLTATDLRSLGALTDLADPNFQMLQPDLDLGALSSSFDFDGLVSAIDGVLPGAGQAVNNLARRAENGVKYDFPLLDDPAGGVMSILLGKDADLFTFQASVVQPSITQDDIVSVPLPIGLDMSLSAGFGIDAKFSAGYDTFGLRETLRTGNPARMLDGFYFGADTHFSVGGGIIGEAGVDTAFFDAGLDGGITANVNIATDPASDLDGDAKVRCYNELDQHMFTASGSIDLFLGAWVKIGVEIAGEFIGYEDRFDIGRTSIVSFDFGHIGNPFAPPPQLMLANTGSTATPLDVNNPQLKDYFIVTAPNGVLTLNVGANAANRGYETGQTKENFVVFHAEAPPGVDPASLPQGDIVTVTSYGFTQTYIGVKKIVADAGNDNDAIVIKDGINVPVELFGGDGDDRLVSESTGTALLGGGNGNDSLTVTVSSSATLDGGLYDDQLFGGTGNNTLVGDFGNDLLIGGNGSNHIDGGRGADTLQAGPNGDMLIGDGENDHIATSTGNDTVDAGRGDDMITWVYGNGSPRIDGGAGRDNVGLVGSSVADTFTVNRDNLAGYEVNILAPDIAGGTLAILATGVEELGLEGRDGTDTITVNDVTNTSVRDISINVGDIVDLDGAVDHVTVNGTTANDNMLVERETALLSFGTRLRGGITRVSGLPTYVVHAANVADDMLVRSLAGNDTLTVASITGPTRAQGNEGDDQMNVTALAIDGYPTVLDVDAGAGHNGFAFTAGGIFAADVTLTDSTVTSNFNPQGANYFATGGDYALGVSVTTGGGADKVTVLNTLAGTTTSVSTAGNDDTVTVSSDGTTTTGTLSTIRSKLNIDTGAGAANVVNLVDTGANSGNGNVVIDPQGIYGFAGASDEVTVAYQSTGGSMKLALESSTNPLLAEKFTIESPSAALQINSNAGNETFSVRSIVAPTDLLAGAGDDTFNVANTLNALDGIQAPLKIVGDAGADVLNLTDTGASGPKAYTLTSATMDRTGAAQMSFSQTESLKLNATTFQDTFVVAQMPAATTDLLGNSGKDVLIGPNTNNAWLMNAADTGSLNSTTRFVGVESLTGGTLGDVFSFAKFGLLSGTLIGDSGDNTLDYSSYLVGVTVDLPGAKATGVAGSVFNIDNVMGSYKSDVLIGDSEDNVLVGRGGRDLLIGGLGADKLFGGEGDDILIAGTTTHDADPVALAMIMKEWNRLDRNVVQRINNLRNGGGLNGAHMLNALTVTHDSDVDQLRGEAGADWFWAKPVAPNKDLILDQSIMDQVN